MIVNHTLQGQAGRLLTSCQLCATRPPPPLRSPCLSESSPTCSVNEIDYQYHGDYHTDEHTVFSTHVTSQSMRDSGCGCSRTHATELGGTAAQPLPSVVLLPWMHAAAP
jgi:hypothetical protein